MREYGQRESGGSRRPTIVVVHGGPGAPGSMAAVARRLADSFHVLEPFQRRSGGEALTVACHVADLRELIDARCQDERPALVGHSWGAMLALATAAAHPAKVGPLVLIGSGTFDQAARDRLKVNRDSRMDGTLKRRLDDFPSVIPDPDARMMAMGELLLPVDSYELVGTDSEMAWCDVRGYRESWNDMVRLQEEGAYPAAFSSIETPVLMLHGGADPHPGNMIRQSLEPFVPQLEYREWDRCGHYPWLERAVRDEFFRVLIEWLASQSDRDVPGTTVD